MELVLSAGLINFHKSYFWSTWLSYWSYGILIYWPKYHKFHQRFCMFPDVLVGHSEADPKPENPQQDSYEAHSACPPIALGQDFIEVCQLVSSLSRNVTMLWCHRIWTMLPLIADITIAPQQSQNQVFRLASRVVLPPSVSCIHSLLTWSPTSRLTAPHSTTYFMVPTMLRRTQMRTKPLIHVQAPANVQPDPISSVILLISLDLPILRAYIRSSIPWHMARHLPEVLTSAKKARTRYSCLLLHPRQDPRHRARHPIRQERLPHVLEACRRYRDTCVVVMDSSVQCASQTGSYGGYHWAPKASYEGFEAWIVRWIPPELWEASGFLICSVGKGDEEVRVGAGMWECSSFFCFMYTHSSTLGPELCLLYNPANETQ